MSLRKNKMGEMVPATSTNDVECYAYKFFLDIYNSSNETKIMRDIQVVFSESFFVRITNTVITKRNP